MVTTKAKPWAHLYDRHWRRRRAAHLKLHPLCVACERRGVVEAATVCDHVVPHRGDPDLFKRGEITGLCARCHDADKQRLEKSGRVLGSALDGSPLDPKHLWNVEPHR